MHLSFLCSIVENRLHIPITVISDLVILKKIIDCRHIFIAVVAVVLLFQHYNLALQGITGRHCGTNP